MLFFIKNLLLHNDKIYESEKLYYWGIKNNIKLLKLNYWSCSSLVINFQIQILSVKELFANIKSLLTIFCCSA